MPQAYQREDVRTVPPAYHVRTVKVDTHRVLVAFPPGAREKGSGVVVAVLHPKNENPSACTTRQKNPAELILMGVNPMKASTPYDALDRKEKLAFGRMGLGKAQLQSHSDIQKARDRVRANERFRNRLPNPGGTAAQLDAAGDASSVQQLYQEFHETSGTRWTVRSEPHIASGDYTDLGKFLDIKVKPVNGGPVQIISFEGGDIRLICDASGTQLYLAGNGQDLDDASLRIFTDDRADRVLLGKARMIAYQAVKWHRAVPDGARGKDKPYEHRFGEDNGTEPDVWYSRSAQRLIIGRASYHVEGAGIVN